jgi:hypothetical protein
MASLGIQQTKEVLDFVLSLSKAMQRALEDGELSWSDALDFVEPLKKLGPAIADIEDVIAELQDMDSSEFQELVEYVGDMYGIEDAVEERIEDAVNTGVEVMKLVRMFKN